MVRRAPAPPDRFWRDECRREGEPLIKGQALHRLNSRDRRTARLACLPVGQIAVFKRLSWRREVMGMPSHLMSEAVLCLVAGAAAEEIA